MSIDDQDSGGGVEPNRKNSGTESKPIPRYPLLATAILVGVIIWRSSREGHAASDTGRYADLAADIGVFLLYGVLIAAVAGKLLSFSSPLNFQILFQRIYTLVVGALALWLIVATLPSSKSSDQNPGSFTAVFEEDMRKWFQLAAQGEQIEFRFQTDNLGKTQNGRAREAVRRFLKEEIETHNQLNRELAAAERDRILDPQRLQEEGGFARSRSDQARAVKAWEDFFEKTNTAGRRFAGYIRRSDLPTDVQDDIIGGFLQSIKQTQGKRARIQDTTRAFLNSQGKLLDFLGETKDRWTFNDDLFVFDRDEDLHRFRALYQEWLSSLNRMIATQNDAIRNAELPH